MIDASRVIKLTLIILLSVSCMVLYFLAWLTLWPWMSWTFSNLEHYIATDPMGFVWFLLHFVPLSAGVLVVFVCSCYLIAALRKLVAMIQFDRKKFV